MELKFRDYIFIVFCSVTPFLGLMLALNFSFSDKISFNKVFMIILTIVLGFVSLISFIIALFYTIDHIWYHQEKWVNKIIHLLFLFLFSVIYIPFYYGTFMVREKVVGLALMVVTSLIMVFFGYSSSQYLFNYLTRLDVGSILVREDFNFLAKNKLFTIDLNKDYVCDKSLGDYVVSCDNKLDDSFLGIYSYNYQDYSMGQLDEVYRFHLSQTKDYIKDAGYTYNVTRENDIDLITYNDDKMAILIKEIDYDVDGDQKFDYRLIVIKELSFNEKMIEDFNLVINSIKFVGSI